MATDIIPLSDRPFIIGNEELMAYLGISTYKTLKENYLLKGLSPKQIGNKLYYYKKDIDKFITKNNTYGKSIC